MQDEERRHKLCSLLEDPLIGAWAMQALTGSQALVTHGRVLAQSLRLSRTAN
jgi:hypothetical protein